MRCKQCEASFPKGQGYDMWQFRRQRVEPTGASEDSETSAVHVEDAGIFCSRECLRGYLTGTDQSGILGLNAIRRAQQKP